MKENMNCARWKINCKTETSQIMRWKPCICTLNSWKVLEDLSLFVPNQFTISEKVCFYLLISYFTVSEYFTFNIVYLLSFILKNFNIYCKYMAFVFKIWEINLKAFWTTKRCKLDNLLWCSMCLFLRFCTCIRPCCCPALWSLWS